jgi:hypothetical protein
MTTSEPLIATAEAAVHDVERALLDGEPNATAADLVDAEDALERERRILDRGSEIDRQRAATVAEAARLARCAEIDKLIRTRYGKHEGDLLDRFDEAVGVLVALVETAEAHNSDLADLVAEIHQLGDLPRSTSYELPPSTSYEVSEATIRVRTPDVVVEPIGIEALIAEAAHRAIVAAGNQPTSSLSTAAGLFTDPALSAYYGVPNRADGAAQPVGTSDRIRRTARLVADRDS